MRFLLALLLMLPVLAWGQSQAPQTGSEDFALPAEGKVVRTFSGGKGGWVIQGNSGDPVLAIADGEVIFAGQGPKAYGNLLIVRHEGGLLSVYAHNRALLVQEGSQVRKGQKIAEMGDSGADRAQLGFELRRNGRPIDPESVGSFAEPRHQLEFAAGADKPERDRLSAMTRPQSQRDSASSGQSSLPRCTAAETDFVTRRLNCFGTLTWPNGEKYVGEFRDGKYHGQGTTTFPDGRKYVGEWRDNRQHGVGISYRADGSVLSSGRWEDDQLAQEFALDRNRFPFGVPSAGAGKADLDWGQSLMPPCPAGVNATWHNCSTSIVLPSGGRYFGEFRDGLINGRGTFTFPSGAKYVGHFRIGRWHGEGIHYRSDGSVLESGRWENDQLVQRLVLDTNRFPFSGQVADAGKAERDRLDTETERRRQQELEQKLAAETRERERLASEARDRERLATELEAERKKRQELEARVTAAERQPIPSKPLAAGRQERRVALVIGNSAYKINPLVNPANDASDVASALRSLGFETVLVRDASIGQIREVTRKFADSVATSDVALIFYAGHGIEAKGRNYLIPVTADIRHEYELEDQAYDAGRWLDMLENMRGSNRQRVNIVILDACRDNAFSRGWRAATRGLGRMDAPAGTFIAFATAPGKVAADGDRQRNSPFTKSLLKAIQEPNLPIELMFKEVRRLVLEETKGEQVPWDNSSLVGNFVFKR